MKPDDKAKAIFIAVYIGSSLLFTGICFGFLRELTRLPIWACALIAPPSGVLAVLILVQLGIWSDGPTRR